MAINVLFPTSIVNVICNLDLDRLNKKCLEFQKNNKSEVHSNIGGYQGQNFIDDELFSAITENIPKVEDKILNKFNIYSWLNINKKGSFNRRHCHDPYAGIFLCGVFYVKTPKNCGNILFYDPRPHISLSPDMKFYANKSDHMSYTPIENQLLIFPPWLEHEVEQNLSDKDRISISFNISHIECKLNSVGAG